MADKTILLSKDPSQISHEILAVEGDNNTYTIEFIAPRYSGGVDLANLTWGINVKNAALEQGFINLSAVTSDADYVYISWDVGSFATELSGLTFYTVEGRNNSDSAHPVWRSSIGTLQVARAVSSDDVIDGSSIDTITEIAETVAESIVGNSVRYDETQSLNGDQKAQARENIGVVNVADDIPLRAYKENKGNPGLSKKWANITPNNRHIAIPIEPGDIIDVVGGSSTTYLAFVKSYTAPTANTDDVDYSEGFSEGDVYTDRISLAANNHVRYVTPNDAAYLIITTLLSNADRAPKAVIINGYDYALSVANNVVDLSRQTQDQLEAAAVVPLTELELYNGFIGTNGTWVNFAGNYKTAVLPCRPGASFAISGTASTYYAVLTSKPVITSNIAIPFSTYDNWNSRKSAASTSTGILPNDAQYIAVTMIYNNTDVSPSSLMISGADYMKTVYENMEGLIDTEYGRKNVDVSWESGTFSQTIGSPATNQNNVNRQRTLYPVRLEYPVSVTTDGLFNTGVVLFDNNLNVLNTASYSIAPKQIPANTYFRLLISLKENASADISGYTSAQISEHISVGNDSLKNIVNPSVNWCAMGDSITEGYISRIPDISTDASYVLSQGDAWAYKLAQERSWILDNHGIGGTGYLHVNSSGNNAAWNIVQNIDFNKYDFVTLAYGVNDWKYNENLGTFDDPFSITDPVIAPTSIYSAMRFTIEKIIASNPLCKIYVLSPINCCAYGTEENNWGISYPFNNNGTLEQIYQAIKTVCEYYGIEFIDMLHCSIVNRKNINTCLLDGVHPTPKTHTYLAKHIGGMIHWTY